MVIGKRSKKFIWLVLVGLVIILLSGCDALLKDEQSKFEQENQTFFGTANYLHILPNLAPEDNYQLDCPFKGKTRLETNTDGEWRLFYEGECWHQLRDTRPAFVCGGKTCDYSFAWGTYTTDPLEFHLDESKTPCPEDTFSFDGSTLEGSLCNLGTKWDIYTFKVSLDDSEVVPEDEATPTEEPTPGLGCNPQVRGLSPSKIGDVISPGASYFDANGKEVGVIQDRWYFNGKDSNSIVWDGKQVQVELQWTCLDHSANTRTYIIPAYQVQPAAPSGGLQPSAGDNGKGMSPLGVAAVVGGIVTIIGAAGVGIGYVIKNQLNPPPVPPISSTPSVIPASPADVTPPAVPIPPSPGTPPPLPAGPSAPPSIPTPEDIPQPEPEPIKLPPEARADLINLRGQMHDESVRLREKYQQTRDAANKLTTLKNKNLIKFIFKKGFDVSEWVINSPAEVINKVVIDPALEKVMQKHDTSQDANIIVQINNRIESLKVEMHQMANEVKYLEMEIAKINAKLAV